MTRLIETELRRLLARRILRVIALALAVGVLVAGPTAFSKSNRDIAGATAKARAEAERGYLQCIEEMRGKGGGCEEPRLAEITAEPRFKLVSLVDVSENVAAIALMLALVMGSSFVGADWNHRLVTTVLTWEPRRERVLLAKIAAVSLVAFLGAVAFEAILGAALAPAAIFRGTVEGVTPSWFATLSGSILRVGLAAAFAGALGCILATIGRATAAALGGVFAWLAVGENIIRNLAPGWTRWMIGDSLGAFLKVAPSDEAVRVSWSAGLLLLSYLLLAAAVAAHLFRTRDVA